MPLAGKGMLLTSMNIDAADEADFNRWYDREHLEERVAIEGPAMRNEGARDWFVLIDGTRIGAVSAIIAERFTGPAASRFPLPVSVGTYSLMWDLAKSDIAPG